MNLSVERLDVLFKRGKPEGKVACLYSGWLDSSVAYHYYGGTKHTVVWEGFETDDDNACMNKILITKQDVVEAINEGIFDLFERPVVETGIFPLYIAYKRLAEWGYTHIVTGDGGDELFMGYKYSKLAYLKPKVVYDEVIRHLFAHHVYIAKTLSKKFGVQICSPFLNTEVIRFALALPLSDKCTLTKDKIILSFSLPIN